MHEASKPLLRRVLQRYFHKDGYFEHLECGHHVPQKRGRPARRGCMWCLEMGPPTEVLKPQ